MRFITNTFISVGLVLYVRLVMASRKFVMDVKLAKKELEANETGI